MSKTIEQGKTLKSWVAPCLASSSAIHHLANDSRYQDAPLLQSNAVVQSTDAPWSGSLRATTIVGALPVIKVPVQFGIFHLKPYSPNPLHALRPSHTLKPPSPSSPSFVRCSCSSQPPSQHPIVVGHKARKVSGYKAEALTFDPHHEPGDDSTLLTIYRRTL